jgi:hypothetical protein
VWNATDRLTWFVQKALFVFTHALIKYLNDKSVLFVPNHVLDILNYRQDICTIAKRSLKEPKLRHIHCIFQDTCTCVIAFWLKRRRFSLVFGR